MTRDEILQKIEDIIDNTPHNKLANTLLRFYEALEKIKPKKTRAKEYGEDYGKVYKEAVDIYFKFFNHFNKRDPKFSKAEGNLMKESLKYLKNVSSSGTWEEAGTLITQIFRNWNKLPKFYEGKEDIKLIYSQINSILNELTRAKAIQSDSIQDINELISTHLQSKREQG
jgi:GTP1/Obg family GTP-binding protein